MLSKETKADMIFVRHAESQYNAETLQYVARKQMDYDWEHLSRDHQYLTEHKYAYHLLDADITTKGHQECAKAREELALYDPDVIIVSPLNRTLHTCSLIFPNPSCPVIVEPILAEGVRSACDLAIELPGKRIIYPSYNFDRVEKQGQFWFIKNQSEENQSAYYKIIAENEGKSYEEVMKAIFAMMLQTWIYETATNLRKRADRVKEMLREYRKSYKRIAVVSHYNIIRFTLAKEFNERDQPFHCHIANCEVLPAEIAEL